MCQVAIFPRALNEFPEHQNLVKFLDEIRSTKEGRYLLRRLARVTKGFRQDFQPRALVLFRLGGGISGCAVARTAIEKLVEPIVEPPETGIGLETYPYLVFFHPGSILTFEEQVPITEIEAAIGPAYLPAKRTFRHATYILLEDCQVLLRLSSILPAFPAEYLNCCRDL